MQLATITALLAGIAPAQATSQLQIVSDIEMSEFTPPLHLTVDITSGDYSIEVPIASWPNYFPQPAKRSGRLSYQTLESLQRTFGTAVYQGLANHKCVAAQGKGYQLFSPSNAGVPKMSLIANGKLTSTSLLYDCWTPAARTLHAMLEKLFDRRFG